MASRLDELTIAGSDISGGGDGESGGDDGSSDQWRDWDRAEIDYSGNPWRRPVLH